MRKYISDVFFQDAKVRKKVKVQKSFVSLQND